MYGAHSSHILSFIGNLNDDKKYQNLQEIEMARAKMRSLALYSPLEHVLQKSIDDYVRAIRPKNAVK